jgi:hypothetical protein
MSSAQTAGFDFAGMKIESCHPNYLSLEAAMRCEYG